MKKKLLYFFPVFFVLASPWFYRLSYENIKLAVPTLSLYEAQGHAFGLSLVVTVVALFYCAFRSVRW